MLKNKILEKFHSRKTQIMVRVFVNVLLTIGFLALLIFCYRLGEFNGWILYLLLIVLTIFLRIYFYKIISRNYKRVIISVISSIVLIFLLVMFYNKLFIKTGVRSETWDIGPFLIALYTFVRVFLNIIIGSIFHNSLNISENMSNLPKSVKGKKTIVQFSLSRAITPSEAGFLMYGVANISNLLCIIYKWYNEKIVDIYQKDGIKYMKVMGKLNENAPDYEKFLFHDMLETKSKNVKLDKYKLRQYNIDVNNMIFENCIKKGYCNKNTISYRKILESTGFCVLALVLSLCLIKDFFLFILFFWRIFIIFGIICIFSKYVSYKKYSYTFTDKGKKIFSEIYGYKYYLEKCEEDEITVNLGKSQTKILPYAIALKLNWGIIDKLY